MRKVTVYAAGIMKRRVSFMVSEIVGACVFIVFLCVVIGFIAYGNGYVDGEDRGWLAAGVQTSVSIRYINSELERRGVDWQIEMPRMNYEAYLRWFDKHYDPKIDKLTF